MHRLVSVLSELASTLLTDFSIQGTLDRLVVSIAEVLPVDAAGITLISPGVAPHYVAASDDLALTLERLQTESGEGPCRLAYESGEPVAVTDLTSDPRFPRFLGAAKAKGLDLGAAFAFPLRHDDGRVGALDLYCHAPGPLSDEDFQAAATLADVAAAYILNAQSREMARETSDRFRDSSLRDALTGLPNRVLLDQRLQHAAERAERSRSTSAVLFADLDRFKDINDAFGHQVGDDALVAVAERLTQLLRPGDTLARISGDEFVFLCEDLRQPSDIEGLAARIDEAFDRPFVVGGLELSISASVGMAYAGPGETVSQELVANADVAMYQAKRKAGGTRAIVDLRQAHHGGEATLLSDELAAAFAGEQLDLAYQPIVRPTDAVVTGVEALLRWTHPDRGPIRTTDMIGIAERNGLIVEIGAWVLRRACTERQRWLAAHPGLRLDLAVNVSTRQLMGHGFCAMVEQVLADTGTDPRDLVLELTEGIFIQDGERATRVLAELRELGVRIALDDFGTGYSSLGYLRRFPVDVLKIDQSFVGATADDQAGSAIVRAVTGLAHELEMTVVAEGVETADQLRAVVKAACDEAQGYYCSRPVPGEVLAEMLKTVTGDRLCLPFQLPVGPDALSERGGSEGSITSKITA